MMINQFAMLCLDLDGIKANFKLWRLANGFWCAAVTDVNSDSPTDIHNIFENDISFQQLIENDVSFIHDNWRKDVRTAQESSYGRLLRIFGERIRWNGITKGIEEPADDTQSLHVKTCTLRRHNLISALIFSFLF